MSRFIDGLKEAGHAYVDAFVRPLKIWFPWEVSFWRPDNAEGWFAWRAKPLGYWLGHIAAWIVIGAVVWHIAVSV